MKKSINAWSVDSKTGFEEMFAEIKAAGFDGIELNVDSAGHSMHSLTMETRTDELRAIKELSDKYGLAVVSISSSLYGGKMGSTKEEDHSFVKELLTKQLECAKELGAGGILIVPGGISLEVSIRQAYETSFSVLMSLKQGIAAQNIFVGVENVWNGFFMSPFDMARFIDRLDCENIGAYYDVGNVITFSWSEYWIDILGKRIRNVHIKDFKRNGGLNSGGRFVDLLKGDVNWQKVMPALKESGFQGYLTAEVFKADENQSYEAFYQEVSNAIDKILAYI